jgi:ribonuclease E
MLINATQAEELRVAMVDGQYLYDLDIEVTAQAQKKASVYKGKITRIEPSLEAAFIDYGAERHGFLPFKEVAREYFVDESRDGRGRAKQDARADESRDGRGRAKQDARADESRDGRGRAKQDARADQQGDGSGGRVTIQDALREGQELIVQVEKEERGTKGAALTTFPSLAGRYLVLMPNNPRAGGISRRVEGEERSHLREALSSLDVPAGMGLIVRTAGVGKSAEELQWDLDYLLKLWSAIESAAHERQAPALIFQDSNIIIRAIRDYFRQDISEILIDQQQAYDDACDFMRQVMPQSLSKVKLYDSNVPLFSRYQIEGQIEAAFGHAIRLPSGGSLVIDHTEALVSVDINSARATKGAGIEETALSTNLEAADEIARQLRLRDIGGLIVIDFIDMTPARNQRDVEERLREALKRDRARVQLGRISRFGLLEMSRQRLRPSLGDSSQMICPTCNGQGHVRGPESLALSILRVIEEEAMKETTGKILAKLPLDVATFLLNEKRENVHDIEQRCNVQVILVPVPGMTASAYQVERVRDDDDSHESNKQPSYEIAETPDALPDFVQDDRRARIEEPAVGRIQPPAPAPPPAAPSTGGGGLLKRMWSAIFGDSTDTTTRDRSSNRGESQRSSRGGRGGRGRGRGGDRQRDQQRRQDSDRRRSNTRSARSQQSGRGRSASRDESSRRGGSSEARQSAPRPERDGERTQEAKPTARTTGNQGGSRSGSKRGRRGGRGRGRGGSGERRSDESRDGGARTAVAGTASSAPGAAESAPRAPQARPALENASTGGQQPPADSSSGNTVAQPAAAKADESRDGRGRAKQDARAEPAQATDSGPAPAINPPSSVDNAPSRQREQQTAAPLAESTSQQSDESRDGRVTSPGTDEVGRSRKPEPRAKQDARAETACSPEK